jgi:spermidine synthase
VPLSRRSAALLAGVLFTLSGALGLGYQLVWIRKATLIVGASQIALATVLTSFFLGLAFGSLWVGTHLRSRRLSPLFVYGLFEAAIGIYAFGFPFLFEAVESAYGFLYPYAEGNGQVLFLLRFSLLFLLFIVPTFFMGGTLPLLLDGIVDRDASIGSLTSLFYGLNIVGAVIGVLLTGYLAIPTLGMNGTSLAAGVGNISIAALALLFFRRVAPIHTSNVTAERLPGLGVFFSSLAVVSGLVTIGYQVAWARYFSLFNDATVYLTAVLLSVFLAALATGSIVMSRILARGLHPLRVVALSQPVAALLVLYGLDWWTWAEYQLPRSNSSMEPSWQFFSQAADATFFAPLFQIGLVVFLPVTLLGTALPGIIAAATHHSTELRNASGRRRIHCGLCPTSDVGSQRRARRFCGAHDSSGRSSGKQVGEFERPREPFRRRARLSSWRCGAGRLYLVCTPRRGPGNLTEPWCWQALQDHGGSRPDRGADHNGDRVRRRHAARHRFR